MDITGAVSAVLMLLFVAILTAGMWQYQRGIFRLIIFTTVAEVLRHLVLGV
jgi:hypothetical protein